MNETRQYNRVCLSPFFQGDMACDVRIDPIEDISPDAENEQTFSDATTAAITKAIKSTIPGYHHVANISSNYYSIELFLNQQIYYTQFLYFIRQCFLDLKEL